MKKLLPLYIILALSLSFCKKSGTAAPAVKPATPPIDTTAVITPTVAVTGFTPHTDTFSGMCNTSIAANSFYDTMVPSKWYVNYISIDYVIVTGNLIIVDRFPDGYPPTYSTGLVSYGFTSDSSGNGTYTERIARHVYNTVILIGDSLNVAQYSSPASCTFQQIEAFIGKKSH